MPVPDAGIRGRILNLLPRGAWWVDSDGASLHPLPPRPQKSGFARGT
jgi:hypothetical protein